MSEELVRLEPQLITRPPPALLWKALLAIGIVARFAAEEQASQAREFARAEAARTAAVEARRLDSTRLAAAVDSGKALSSERAWQVDWTLHNSSLGISHESLHRRVVGLQLDSTARLLRLGGKNLTYAVSAREVFSLVQAPLSASQQRRQAELSRQLTRLDRRIALEAQRKASRARVQAQSLQPVRPRKEAPQPPTPSHPAGASALCRDGTYSYSVNRRGTCSHHGGVSEWL